MHNPQVPGRWQCLPRDPRGGEHRRPPRFGYGRSRDLLQWEDLRLISVPLADACSLWAPELTLIPPGEGEAADGGAGGAAGSSGGAVPGEDLVSRSVNQSDGGGLFSADYGGGDGGAWAGAAGASFMVSFSATRHAGECPHNMCDAGPMTDWVVVGGEGGRAQAGGGGGVEGGCSSLAVVCILHDVHGVHPVHL